MMLLNFMKLIFMNQTSTATIGLLLRRTACTFLSLISNVSRNGAAAQRKNAAIAAPLRSLREIKLFK